MIREAYEDEIRDINRNIIPKYHSSISIRHIIADISEASRRHIDT